MSRAKTSFRTATGELSVGPLPRVVGTLSALPKDFSRRKHKAQCDIVEVRFDRISLPPKDWLQRCEAIEAAGWPVLFTVRSRAEGGFWQESDKNRLEIFRQALQSVAAVDVELSSDIAVAVGKLAKKAGKACVVSFHDFDKTPPLTKLESIVRKAQKFASVVKISTMIKEESDVETLRALLDKKWKTPLCVIGMGAAWTKTRITFPKLGSCLTYGYLDKPTAPGQISAAALVKHLRKAGR
jgi:3-dehydroquinate dehydratase-1